MDKNTPLSALSDAEFIALLKERQKDANWTMGQLEEYERRGSDFLANEEGLRENIETTLENHYDKMRSIFEPAQKSWNVEMRSIFEPIQKSLNMNLNSIFEPIQETLNAISAETLNAISAETLNSLSEFIKPLPPLPNLSIAPPSLRALIKDDPSLADKDIESPLVEKATQSEMGKSSNSTLAVWKRIANNTENTANNTENTANNTEEIKRDTEEIKKNTRFGWRGKVMLGASIVAAIGSVVGVVVGVVGVFR
jgi:hypothetical protein